MESSRKRAPIDGASATQFNRQVTQQPTSRGPHGAMMNSNGTPISSQQQSYLQHSRQQQQIQAAKMAQHNLDPSALQRMNNMPAGYRRMAAAPLAQGPQNGAYQNASVAQYHQQRRLSVQHPASAAAMQTQLHQQNHMSNPVDAAGHMQSAGVLSPPQNDTNRNQREELSVGKSYLMSFIHKENMEKQRLREGVQTRLLKQRYPEAFISEHQSNPKNQTLPLSALLSLPGEAIADDDIDEDEDLLDSWDVSALEAPGTDLVIDGRNVDEWTNSGTLVADMMGLGLDTSALDNLLRCGDAIWADSLNLAKESMENTPHRGGDLLPEGFSKSRESSILDSAGDSRLIGKSLEWQQWDCSVMRNYINKSGQ